MKKSLVTNEVEGNRSRGSRVTNASGGGNGEDSGGRVPGLLEVSGGSPRSMEHATNKRLTNECLCFCLSVCQSVCVSSCVYVSLLVFLPVYRSVCLSFCSLVFLSVYRSVCLSFCLSVCRCICLFPGRLFACRRNSPCYMGYYLFRRVNGMRSCHGHHMDGCPNEKKRRIG